MALDEGFLEWVRREAHPTLVLRTYRWETPTLSLGANQKVRDINFLLEFYGHGKLVSTVVRRPTGGRAILHGKDISYAFITNEPETLRKSLKDSYAIYAGLTQQAFKGLSIQTDVSESAGNRDYLRSPVCFDTHTPSDLLGADGRKISGSAQLRRSGGLLQHGAAFLEDYGIDEPAFFNALSQAVHEQLKHPVTALALTEAQALLPAWPTLRVNYRKSSTEIWESAPTTSGSHLAPASF